MHPLETYANNKMCKFAGFSICYFMVTESGNGLLEAEIKEKGGKQQTFY